MDEQFQREHDQNQIELKLFLEESYQLSDENNQALINLYLIQDWLADLETRAAKLADRFRTQTH
jgi:hypothetical protein